MNRVELFRRKLQQTIDAVEDKTDEYGRGIRAVAKALKHDFDVLFPEEAYSMSGDQLRALIEQYCYPEKNRCPLCGEKNIKRKGIKSHFYGCSTYPICRGARGLDGKVTMNEALREFISQKLYEKAMEEEKASQNRFANLDI